MKKRILSLALAFAMTASLVACGGGNAGSGNGGSTGGDSGSSAGGNTESSEPVEISFYTTETGKDDMFKDMIADFEGKNPGITVEYIAAGDDQLQAWMALYASNEGPTVSLMDPINIWENQERMLELTGQPLLDNIEESSLSTLTFDGKVYAAPMSAAGIGILYNKAVCDEAVGGDFDPDSIKTQNDLEDLLQKIEATGRSGSCLTGVNWSLGAHYLCQSYGAAIGDVDARVAYVNGIIAGENKHIDSDVFNGYMDTFDILAKYNINKADPLVGDVNIDAQNLAEGNCGVWFMGDWAWTYLGPIVADGQEFGILPIPHNNDANDPINSMIPTSYAKGYCVDKSQNDEAKQAAGVKFIEYITGDSYAQELMAKTAGQALPFKNANVTIESPLGLSTAKYIAAGRTFDFYGTPNLAPSDIWYECGAYMCEYLQGACDRQSLADRIDAYWANQEPR